MRALLPLVLAAVALYALTRKTAAAKPAKAIKSGTTITIPRPTEPDTNGSDDTRTLTTEEMDFLTNATDDEIYAAAIGSNHLGFVIAAADLLAQHGDSRAMELTVTISQWKAGG
jgi:hypothetical protein